MVSSEALGQLGQSKETLGSTDKKGTISLPDLSQFKTELKKKEPTPVVGKPVPLDGPVNPAQYYVGPSDVLSLNIWSSSPMEHELTVSPEGSLLIPNVGAVSVKELTLEVVKRRVGELVSRKYPHSEVSLTLMSPRKVSVTIVGAVFNEGMYEMYSVQRASNLIATANEPLQGQSVKEYYSRTLPKLKREASERNILIKHRDGSVGQADLVQYRITHLDSLNPYLREGDIVYVPERKDFRNSIAIFGAAGKFGSFEFVPGDSLTDLVMMGYGFKDNADSEHARFSRLSADGSTMETTTIDAKAVMERRVQNIALQPGDRVFIPEMKESRSNYFVAVEGEVVQQGQYPITKNTTKLSDVIRTAGGFTKDANISGAVLIRMGGAVLEVEEKMGEELLLSKRSRAAEEDSSYYLVETELRLKGELVSIDFHKLFVLGDSTQDVILQTYDKIIVPPRRGTVYVFGQVGSPGHVPLVEGKGYRYYIDKTGGFTESARSGDVKIIKGNTRAWLNPGETNIEDGDYIWVPKELIHPFSYYLTTYVQIASIIGVVATVALVAVTARK